MAQAQLEKVIAEIQCKMKNELDMVPIAIADSNVYVSRDYATKNRLLVILPCREAGIWSSSICLTDLNSGSMLGYLKKAKSEDYGVLVMNPVVDCSGPKLHVCNVWHQLVTPLACKISILVYSRGSQWLMELLNNRLMQEMMQKQVVAIALVEPNHVVEDSDSYFAKRMLARRTMAWMLSNEIGASKKIDCKSEKFGCVCVSAGSVPEHADGTSGGWAIAPSMDSIFCSLAARHGQMAGITVNSDTKSCGICKRKLSILKRKVKCKWCELMVCSHCSQEVLLKSTGLSALCLICCHLPCLITPDTTTRASVHFRPQPDLSLDDFEMIKLIGKGACGRVKLVRKNHGVDEGHFYAMKVIPKHFIVERGLVDAANTEHRIMNEIRHPYIARLKYSFQTSTKLYLLTEYYPGGSLLTQLHIVGRFSIDRVILYAAEMALALSHLHENNILYRDLKLENVLCDKHGHIALTDFGLSKDKMPLGQHTNSIVGTYEMMAPEMVQGTNYNHSIDWWALGIMIYEMIEGRAPFKGTSYVHKLHFSSRFSTSAKQIIGSLLEKDPSQRLGSPPNGFSAIQNHPFFQTIHWQELQQRQQTFNGQNRIMKVHAKEYSTNDIFQTYMASREKIIDTPTHHNDSHETLFQNYTYNFIDDELSSSAA